ncbi:MAG: hypothetical protein AAFR27_15575, partial [Pseudomonadota bacterium]
MGIETLAASISLAALNAGLSSAFASGLFTVLTTVGPALITTTASVGFSLAQSARARQNIRPLNQDAGFQQVVRQSIPAQRLLLGTPTTAGALFFAKGDPPYTWYGYVLAAHKTDGLDSLFINNERVFLDADGLATSTPFKDGDNVYIEASFRNGDINQAIDPIIARDFPDMPTTFRQRGHTTLVVKRTHGFGGDINAKNEDHRRVFGDTGQFDPLVRLRGALVFDPRKAGHVLSDESTWSHSENAALCFARALTFKWPDMQFFDSNRLDWDKIAEAADECDRWEIDRDGKSFR